MGHKLSVIAMPYVYLRECVALPKSTLCLCCFGVHIYRSNYRTPLHGLYLCGSGTHPGGGVMGAPGRNAARVALEDVNKPLK